MMQSTEEKRKFNRVPFSYNDNIIGTFIRQSNNQKISAHILNLSVQGLYFTLSRDDRRDLVELEVLTLVNINMPRNDDFILNIKIEIKRILDHPEMEHSGYGCYFTSFPESSRDQIKRFLEIWFLESRQG